jgi:hypothetical protein
MADTWQEITGRAVGNIATTRPMRASSDWQPSLSSDQKISKAIEAVIYEFGIRWPCPRDTSPDRYDMRLRDLMRLCAGMAPGLLRKAGDRVAVTPGRPFTLPSAGELHEAADAILADRAAQQRHAAEYEGGPSGYGDRWGLVESNTRLAGQGHVARWILDGSKPVLVSVNDTGNHRCDGIGGVDARFWTDDGERWYKCAVTDAMEGKHA